MPQSKTNNLVADTSNIAQEGQTSLQQQAYMILKEQIQEGEIQAGERLMEVHVANAFGISRSPARHALAMLHKEKLLEENGKRGYYVAGNSVKSPCEQLASIRQQKLTVPRQWELIYKQVEQDLFVFMLVGSVRINDVRLAEHYDVSRTVTRDLLAHMHGLGMITKDPSGHWIAHRITPERIRDLYELRAILEPKALAGAAAHIPAPLLMEFRRNIERARLSAPLDSSRFDQIESDLHIRALNFCPNREILTALRRTHILFGPTRYLYNQLLGIPTDLIQAAIEEHQTIIEHLMAGRVGDASRGLQEHLEAAVSRWLLRFNITAQKTVIELPPYLSWAIE
ncbi:MAG: GntR family transcriptional regulator [Pusillimonas sp.]